MKIRIQNDIILDLSIFRPDKLPEDLSEATEVKVTLSCKGNQFTPSFSHEGNRVMVYFLAGMQKETGFYTVTLQYVKPDGNMPDGKSTYTVDYCDAFKLVHRSCDADEVLERGMQSVKIAMTVDRMSATSAEGGVSKQYVDNGDNGSKQYTDQNVGNINALLGTI